MKEDIILIGGGGHCKACIDVIEMQNKYAIRGIIDLPENINRRVLGYPIIGCDSDLKRFAKISSNFFISLGHLYDSSKKKKIFQALKELKVNIPTLISPYAYVSKHATLGKGSIIMHFAIVNAGAEIGDNCIINTRALVEHDAVIGNHCHISTGAIVNGGAKIGDGSFFGSGAVSKEYIQLPTDSFIKANSLAK